MISFFRFSLSFSHIQCVDDAVQCHLLFTTCSYLHKKKEETNSRERERENTHSTYSLLSTKSIVVFVLVLITINYLIIYLYGSFHFPISNFNVRFLLSVLCVNFTKCWYSISCMCVHCVNAMRCNRYVSASS